MRHVERTDNEATLDAMYRAALLKDGPFADDVRELERLPEHIRVSWCSNCKATHWYDEASDGWHPRAARYSLAESSEDPAVYVYEGVGDGQGSPHETTEYDPEREMVPAGAPGGRPFDQDAE